MIMKQSDFVKKKCPPWNPGNNPTDFLRWTILESVDSRISHTSVGDVKEALRMSLPDLNEDVVHFI